MIENYSHLYCRSVVSKFAVPTFSAVLPSIHAEHSVLCRSLGAVQERCSRVIAGQAAQIAQLQAQVLRLHAQAVRLQTQLAWAAEDRVLAACEPLSPHPARPLAVHPLASAARASFHPEWRETNRVICQVACLSHGAFWRDGQDQCRRSGQACTALGSVERMPDARTAGVAKN